MLSWILFSLVTAITIGILAFSGIAGAATPFAQLLFLLFLTSLTVALMVGTFSLKTRLQSSVVRE